MNEGRPHLLGMLAGLFLAAGLVLSAMLGTSAWLRIKHSQFITVKGSARKNVVSDFVIWRGSFTTEALTLLEAQRKLADDRAKVGSLLGQNGRTNMAFAPIGIEEVKSTFKDPAGWSQQRTAGYRLTQAVRIESGDVAVVRALDGASQQLVEQGIQFTALAPEFIYSKAGEAKVEMLGEATKDARTRAEQVAGQGGGQITRLHSAEMGVFQINPIHSSQTSAEGMNDTTSLEKTIIAVVTATFSLK